ncbi:MAG: 3-deoxy-D-manno-octulosonic acid transferase [Chlorobi bacterium]|nr:3-deoxy-D-manno-octulosonic acid transferase [Chlorobiota bacterium]
MWRFLYRSALYPLFRLAAGGAGAASDKGRRGNAGRTGWREQLSGLRAREPGEFAVHFHAASVGEFEQAKPLIEALRADGGKYRITASFFSPSGFEQQGRYPAVDGACYLPWDRAAEMRDFHDRIAADLVIIIRYDLWPEFLLESARRNVPVALVCGVLRENSARFKPLLRDFFRDVYRHLSLICAVGEEDAAAFRRLVPDVPLAVSGDTRYDRVLARAAAIADVGVFSEGLRAGRRILVAGSTWPRDEDCLQSLSGLNDLLMVIVPHEPTEKHVASLLDAFPGSITLSRLECDGPETPPRAVIVDRTGILAALYRVGDIAYVGGGFGDGVHSVLEPAAYGVPVLSGPGIGRSRDAVLMADAGALTVIADGDDLAGRVNDLLRGDAVRRAGAISRAVVEERIGATGRILSLLRRRRLLPDGAESGEG